MNGSVCSTCNKDIFDYLGGNMGQCANCWEVERRLADYIKSEIGRKFVENSLLIGSPTPKKHEYTVVSSHNQITIDRYVTERMESGWIPQGGIATVRTEDGAIWYFQAMIKG